MAYKKRAKKLQCGVLRGQPPREKSHIRKPTSKVYIHGRVKRVITTYSCGKCKQRLPGKEINEVFV